MRKRILSTLILSMLVLTACSSETPNTTPDEITPTAVEIVERVEKTKAPTPTEKPTQTPTRKPIQKPTEKAKQESDKDEPKPSNNEQDIQNMISYIISHNQSKGMTYDTTLNTSNSGWLFAYQGCLNTVANRTYEEQLSRTVSGLDADIDSILALDGYATRYSQMSFNCYAEKQPDDTYNIYFCYG